MIFKRWKGVGVHYSGQAMSLYNPGVNPTELKHIVQILVTHNYATYTNSFLNSSVKK